MGKLNRPSSHNNKSTQSVKGNAPTKTCSARLLKKRFSQLQRKFITLESEKSSLEDKNKELLEGLQSEKMAHATTRKELFHCNRLYHEAMIKINSYKVKEAEIGQTLRGLLKDYDSSYPHLMQLTQLLTNNKIVFQALVASLPHSGVENVPLRQPQNTGRVSDDFNQINEKRMKQRVGPMVRGCLITKPKIMLERLMLPLPQEQEPTANDTSIEETNNQLTPIQEENEHDEDECLRHISMRPKRKLGSSWKAKRQEKIEKTRRELSKPTSAMDYDNDSSDSESNPPVMNHVEPVVLFRDVSRLLQNSSLMTVDLPRSVDSNSGGNKFSRKSENENCSRARSGSRNIEDPLEGSSWMYKNNGNCHSFRPSHYTDRRSSLIKSSDSNDEDEDEIVPQCNISNTSVMNTLVAKNNTFTVSTKKKSNTSDADMNYVSSEELPVAEPDSTNNIEIPNDSGSDNYSNSYQSYRPSSGSSNISLEYNLVNPLPTNQSLSNCSISLSATPNLSNNTLVFSSRKNSRSILCEGGTEQNTLEGKRIRKPKKHLYPGEEDSEPDCNKSKNSERKSMPAKKPGKKSSTNKKGKMSMHTPRNSAADTTYTGNEESRPARNKKKVCYKESPLNVKQRRP